MKDNVRYTEPQHVLPGGTLPTHALMRWPPTEMVHDPQSPLKSDKVDIEVYP